MAHRQKPEDTPGQHEKPQQPTLSSLSTAMAAANISRSPPSKEAALRSPPSPAMPHRQSFAENLRGMPASPRTQRQPSLTQQALQELLNNPPTAKQHGMSEFVGRDWRRIQVGEVVERDSVKIVDVDTSVEDATKMLIAEDGPHVVLLREKPSSRVVIGTFDYSDLNAYLLLVVGLARPDEGSISSFNELARKGREGKTIPLKDVKDLGKKEPLVTLPRNANLTRAVEIFGSGIHRIIVTEETSSDLVGILSQSTLVKFFWENGRSFSALEPLFPLTLRELNLGSHTVFAISGDRPLTDALELMNNEGITSLPVLDGQNHVLGNISHVDVRLLTKSTSLPLLRSSCLHFITVILSERGVNEGKDSFPVFYVNPFSTLAHTVAKLVATRSHRMWIVDAPSPASSGPSTPAPTPAVVVPPSSLSSSLSGSMVSTSPPSNHANLSTSVGSSNAPRAAMSGRLSGVVSLTDVLNLFARASGLSPHDPDETRQQRRRSSSSSVRRSVDSARSSSVELGLSRSGSVGPGRR